MSQEIQEQSKTIQLPSRGSFPYSVRKSERAKRPLVRLLRQGAMTDYLTPFQIEVVLPKTKTQFEPERLIAEAAGWIEKQVEKWRIKEDQRLKAFQILFQGRPYTLVEKAPDLFNAKVGVALEGDFINVIPDGVSPEEAFYLWFEEEALSAFAAALKIKMVEMNIRPKGFMLREQSSIWGSCSHITQNLSFNRKLAMAPPFCLEYVVVHELAHLVHKGHGKNFWNLVERHTGHQEKARSWLVDNAWRMIFPREILSDGKPRTFSEPASSPQSVLVEF